MMKDKEILVGTKKTKIKGAKCIAYTGQFLIIAFENKSLSIFDNEKLLK